MRIDSQRDTIGLLWSEGVTVVVIGVAARSSMLQDQ